MDTLKKLQIDRLLGFLLTLAVPAVIIWKLVEYILESPTRKQAAINTIFIEALAVFVIIRIAALTMSEGQADRLVGWIALRTGRSKALATGDDTLARARALIAVATPVQVTQTQTADDEAPTTPDKPEHPCPCCGSSMIIIERFEAGCTPRHRPSAPATAIRIDTS